MQNFLESIEFGGGQAGRWYLMLFPCGESSSRDTGNNEASGRLLWIDIFKFVYVVGVAVKVVSCNKESLTARATFTILSVSGEASKAYLLFSMSKDLLSYYSVTDFKRSFDSFKWSANHNRSGYELNKRLIVMLGFKATYITIH